MLMGLVADLRSAMRGLLARPGFALVVVLSLGLGIGLNAVVFSIWQQIALRPLPVAKPEALVNLSAPGPRTVNLNSIDVAGPRESVFSYPLFRDIESHPDLRAALEGIAGHRAFSSNLDFAGQSFSISGSLVSGGYFGVLGLQPALGRLLQPHDDESEDAAVVVLGHAFWRNRLGADAGVLGKTLNLGGQQLMIVGVAPQGFSGTTMGHDAQVFVPLSLRWRLQPDQPRDRDNRTSHWVYAFARLAQGTDRQSAAAAVEGPFRHLLADRELDVQENLDEQAKQQFLQRRLQLSDGAQGQSMAPSMFAGMLMALQAASALILFIACLNIANLMLARGAARAAELAVRAALGGSRARLLRQLLIEAGVLAALGGLLSVALLALVRASPSASGLSGHFTVGIDLAVLAFAAGLALVCTLGFGLLPALAVLRVNPAAVLHGQAAGAAGGTLLSRFRAALAVVQVAFAMAALVLAGLFGQSLSRLAGLDTGLPVESVAGFSVSPQRSGYTPAQSAELFDRIERELAGLPGADGVAASMVPLLAGGSWGTSLTVEQAVPLEEDAHVSWNEVGHDFHRVLGLPVLTGRGFTAADSAGRPRVALVSRRFVEHFGLASDPVGKRMAFGDQTELDIEIVGVVEDSAYETITDSRPVQFYLPWRQNPRLGELSFYLRTSGAPEALLSLLSERLAQIAPGLPVENLRTLQQQVDRSLVTQRRLAVAAAGVSALAIALAALGLFGVLSFTVSMRRREIGLRLALGAAPAQLKHWLLRRLAWLTLAGIALGTLAALMLGAIAEALLFDVTGKDPLSFLVALVVVAAVSLLAAWIPIRQACRLDPAAALRSA